MATINDIVTLVQLAMNNRQDITNSSNVVLNAIGASITEITESYPFDELRVSGPKIELTAGTSLYPLTGWLNAGDTNATQIITFALQYPSASPNITSAIISLDYKYPTAIEPLLVASGPPKSWTRWGSDIILAPTPDQAYVTYMRYQRKHPFGNYPIPDEEDVVYLPDSWIDIVTYASAMRIALSLRATDIWQQYHDLLYGDPEYQTSQGKRGRPGIIAARVFNQERDAMNNVGAIIPVLDDFKV